jgi:hypothetical protein
VAKYQVSEVVASFETPNSEPRGPQGWSFSIISDPVDEGAPHGGLLEAIAAANPDMLLALKDLDSSGWYLEGTIEWGAATLVVWCETQEGFLYVWCLERDPIEFMRRQAILHAPCWF